MSTESFNLLPFQASATTAIVEAIGKYKPTKNLFTSGKKVPANCVGQPKPYLHRLKAITGAGKTPILAATATRLKDAIIIWTTPRGAIISQATGSLKEKYNSLLPPNAQILTLEDALQGKWSGIVEATSGTTIITTTVASWGQRAGGNLNVHKGDKDGFTSPWRQLCQERKRKLWVFYDEGHNATENQFMQLLELQPAGFILASASALSEDLQILLPGEDKEAKEKELNENRTTVIDTKVVVDEGLLKRVIEVHDLDTGDSQILTAAYKKREYLQTLCPDQTIVACYIVDKDKAGTGALHGMEIWEKLVKLGADPNSIAVHLSGVKQAADIRSKTDPQFKKLRATYDEKLSPEDLKAQGFKHLIWNLSLEEGWDEPWAYVGYFHGPQNNETKVTQRIGRLVRNPFKNQAGFPEIPNEKPLQSVYCYLNSPTETMEKIVAKLKADMSTSNVDVLVYKDIKEDKPVETSIVKENLTVPSLYLTPESAKIEKELTKELFKTPLAPEAFLAPGKVTTTTIETGGDILETTVTALDENTPTTIGEVVRDHLEQQDWRLVRARGSTGGWLQPSFWNKPELQKALAVSSPAYFSIKESCDRFLDHIETAIRLTEDDEDLYIVDDIKLINPGGGEDERHEKYYAVTHYKNAGHARYNSMNPLEREVAKALDKLDLKWVRNPAKKGYGIPLIKPSTSSTTFYPDFIIWHKGQIIFLEPTGPQLLDQAILEKLKTLPSKFTLALLSPIEEGRYVLVRRINDKINRLEGTLDTLINEVLA